MNKLMLATALAFSLGVGAASAQVLDTTGGVVIQQARPQAGTVFGPSRYSAFARNVGPGSSVSGHAESDFGGAGSGNGNNPRVPTAGSLGTGGQ